MGYNEELARAGTRAVPLLAKIGSVIFCVGAGFAFFGAIGGTISGEMPAGVAIAIALLGLLFIGGVFYSRMMIGVARRQIAEWDQEESKPGRSE